jgi:putative ABC transport system permease protein
LGASRSRILRQLLIESLVLSCLGGALGILVAIYGVDTYRALAPASVPRMNELHVNLTIAWVALALSSIAGILCGLAPALHTSRPDLNLALKERLSSVAVAHKRFSLRGTLVGVEIALALVLLDGSALMVQSMVRLLRVDAGFRTDHILTAELTLPKSGYATPEAQQIFTQRLLDTLHANERLTHVAMSDSSALTGNQQMTTFYPGTLAEKSTTLQERSVAPGFFETLGIRMISGRQFQETDAKGAPRVAIVNEAMVRRYFSGEDPLGKIVRFSPKAEDQYQIIGIVSDTRDIRLNAAPRPQVYLPLLQNSGKSIHLFIRTEIDPMALAAELRKAVWTIDKDQPVSRVQSMTEIISKSMAEPRFSTWLLGVFAAVGLTLTLVGIYGVVSYMAGQRTREIGIRVALGAPRATVLKLVLGHGIRLALAGATMGVIGALGLTRLLKSQLYEIKPSDPVTLCGAAIIMLLVALVACYVLPGERPASIHWWRYATNKHIISGR